MDALLALGVLLALLATPLLITLAQEVITRWRYRHIPGPRPNWFTGNLTELLSRGMLPAIDSWVAQHGPLTVFRLMARPFVLVADPDAARSVLYKLTNHAPLANPVMHLVSWELRSMDLHGLLMAKDEVWRMIRNAWQPAFASASLRGYQSLMDAEALSLSEGLAARADAAEAEAEAEAAGKGAAKEGAGGGGGGGGGGGCVVEVLSEVSRMTLAVVGSVAYGVDFNSAEYSGSAPAPAPASAAAQHPSAAGGGSGDEYPLVQACRDWFRTMSPSARTKWAVALVLPCMLPLMRRVACALPDEVLTLHIRARRTLRSASTRLIRDWRAAHGAEACAEQGMRSGGGGKAQEGEAQRGAGGGSGGAAGVSPGSFLGLMLAARGRGGGEGLTDAQIEAQVQTFILAGYETTANALTFAIYLLALHPDKAEKLTAELDALLPPLPPHAPCAVARAAEPLGLEVLDKLVYTEAVLQEALRLYPPAHATSRLTDKPMQVCGYDIPVGTTLMIPIAHLQRKEPLWPDGQEFRPERFLPDADGGAASPLAARHPHVHLPFGSGTRMCIGWRFAMQEGKTALARLCQRLRFELEAGQVPLQVAAGLTLAPRHGVRVRVHRRRL